MVIVRKILNLFKKKKEIHLFTKKNFNHPSIVIGDYTYGLPEILYLDSGAKLEIGRFCSIAKNVQIFLGGNHRHDWFTTYPFKEIFIDDKNQSQIEGHPATNGDVLIGNDVWIGRNVTIMSGVSIADGAVIGANSLISKDIGPYEIWAGNPARLIRKRFNEATTEKLLHIKWWEKDITAIKSISHLLSSSIIDNLNQIENVFKEHKV